MRRALTAVAVALVLTACAGPSLEPIGEAPDGTAAGGPVDGCRPALGEDEPHPIRDGAGGHHRLPGGQDWVGPLAAAVQEEHADVLGGLWLDQEAGEVVVMVPSTEGRDVYEDLRADAEHPDAVVCMEATHTLDELLELQEEAIRRLAGEGPVMGGVDVVRNRVDLEYEGDPEEARRALGDLAEHPAVRLSVPDCAETVPPPEGAQPLPGGGSNCSGMDALFAGTLVGDPASGCAWFEDQEGRPLAVLWPRGWSLTEDGRVLDHRGEERARLGDRIESGGGNVPLDEGQRACGSGGDDGAWVVSSLQPASDGATGEGDADE